MTNEHEPARKAPTIDLEATEVEGAADPGAAAEDAAAAEVHDLGGRQSGLVRPDPTRDPIACNRKCPGLGESRVHRAYQPVLEDHARRL